jgi:hypothetical protein
MTPLVELVLRLLIVYDRLYNRRRVRSSMKNGGIRKATWSYGVFLGALVLALGWSFPAAAQSNRGPDLVVESLVLDPAQPDPGAEVELIATLANRGNERVLTSFSVYFEMDNTFLGVRQILSRLAPGSRSEVKLHWTAAEGEHTLRVIVDAFNDVEETNEANNKLEVRVGIRKPEGVRSITLGLLEGIGHGLEKTGQALQVSPNNDLFQLLNAFQAALGVARQELSVSADRISSLRQLLVPPLADEAQVQASDQVATLYRSLAAAFARAIEGIQKLNAQLLLGAFEETRATLLELSRISVEGIRLSPLGETAHLMDQALEKIRQLQAALSGTPGVDVNAITRDLLGLLTQMGKLLTQMGGAVLEIAQQRAARFTDGNGNPVTRYQSGQELKIWVPNARQLKLEIFDLAGRAVCTHEGEGDQLSWKGTDAEDKTLSPGRYFYRLTILESSGDARVELGQITLSGN